ncbi:HEAT repeat domain-containing protein [Planctomycetota bacterium]
MTVKAGSIVVLMAVLAALSVTGCRRYRRLTREEPTAEERALAAEYADRLSMLTKAARTRTAEVERRGEQEKPGPEETEAKKPIEPADPEITRLIDALADDDVKWNAIRAQRRLRELGALAIEPLEGALMSKDYQQRQLAADVLRQIGGYKPSERMLAILVEGLRDDEFPARVREGKTTAYTPTYNASWGTKYLSKHAARAEAFLEKGLESDDAQQKFLCAYIVGVSGMTKHVSKAAGILIDHTKNNGIRGDACLSAAALFRLGKDVLPHLRAALPGADMQQKEVIGALIKDIQNPSSSRRGDYRMISTVRNPVEGASLDYLPREFAEEAEREGE